MTTSNFRIEAVVAIFMGDHNNTQPTQQDLINFDAALEATFGTDLSAIMDAEGVLKNKANRSEVLLISRFSSGNTSRQQIRRACQLFKTVDALGARFFA